MFTLLIKPRAVQMLKHAYEWYEDRQTGLGELFLNEVDECYNKLEKHPELYAEIRNKFRQILVANFPYVIVYEIDGLEIIIYAVFHTSRNPKIKFRKS